MDVGGHSVDHPHLDVLPRTRMQDEIDRCRDTLSQLVQRDVRNFAFPHGSHRRREREHLATTGWRSGAAVKNALSHSADDRFGFARVTITEQTSDDSLRMLLRGEGAPLAWRHDRIRTRAFRQVRRARQRLRPPHAGSAG